jgi:hypothetical protein
MEKRNYVIPLVLISLLTVSAYGFPGMVANKSASTPDLNSTTDSDQDIILMSHLIEVDAVQLQSQNKLLVKETIVFKNNGAMNFSGALRTWVPDGVEGIKIERRNMMDGALEYPIQWNLKDNIISWKDKIDNQSLPPLYYVEYDLKAQIGTSATETKQYVKKFFTPTITKQPSSVALKVTRNEGESITLKDESGNSLSESVTPKIDNNSVLYQWDNPQFTTITLDISKPPFSQSGIAVYVIIGALVLLAISYPVLRRKNNKKRSIEEKMATPLKREKIAKEESAPAFKEEDADEEDSEFQGRTKEELEDLKKELLLKQHELEKDYSSGNLLDEEYEENRKYYREKIKRIERKIG